MAFLHLRKEFFSCEKKVVAEYKVAKTYLNYGNSISKRLVSDET